MEKVAQLLNSLQQNVAAHCSLLFKAARHGSYRKMTDFLALAARNSVIFAFAFCVLLFAALGFTFWISKFTGSLASAFFITSGFFAIGIAVTFALRKPLTDNIRESVTRNLDAGYRNYGDMLEQDVSARDQLRLSEEKLRHEFEELKSLLRLSPAAADAGEPRPDPQPSRSGLAPAAEFLLNNVVLVGAGPLKRLVVPFAVRLLFGSKSGILRKLREKAAKIL
jgi:hypothetical protein